MTEIMAFDPSKKPTKKVEDTGSIAASTKKGGRLYANYQFNPNNSSASLANFIKENAPNVEGLVKSWSPSALKVFESCAYRTYLSRVLKYHEPQSEPAQRGERIHQYCENYVNGTDAEFNEEVTGISKFHRFEKDFEELRGAYLEGHVDLEGEWGFDVNWNPVDWMAPNVWARMKLDVLYRYSDTHARVIDYKTGRKFGNEVSHADQGMQYAVGTFMRYQELEMLDVDFWYLDQGEKSFPKRFTRSQAMVFLPRITDRALRLTTAQERDFKPSPSVYNCKICPFNRDEQGCPWRVQA